MCPAYRPASVWAGLDVAKATFDAALVLEDHSYLALREIPVRTFARTKTGVAQFAAWLEECAPAEASPRVVMEATGAYSLQLTQMLVAARPELAPAIANPKWTKDFMGSLALRNKTDRIDARALGLYGRERRPAPYALPDPDQAELREILRYRSALVDERVAEEHRREEGAATCATVRAMQRRHIAQLERNIEKLETEAREIIQRNPALARDHALLESINGVGFLIAATMLAELGDLRRFERARAAAAFAGVSPRVYQSGRMATYAHMSKQGNPHVRRMLYLAAICAIRGQSELAECYKRLRAKGKPGKVALGAVMRKMLHIMRAILISGKTYQPFHNACGKLAGKPKAGA